MLRFATLEPMLASEPELVLEPILELELEPTLEPILESFDDPILMVQNCQVGPNGFLESVEYGPRNECMANADFVQMGDFGD